MIVILNRDVKGTGKAGDVVKVSDGYARNMLLPKGYATEATDGNIRNLEKQKAIAAEKKAEEKAAAQQTASVRFPWKLRQKQAKAERFSAPSLPRILQML